MSVGPELRGDWRVCPGELVPHLEHEVASSLRWCSSWCRRRLSFHPSSIYAILIILSLNRLGDSYGVSFR